MMDVNDVEASEEIPPSAGEVSVSSNIGSNEIDTETASKLRGDAIGDTMYSEVFVLNTLLQFSDLKWNAEVEDNLCFLWDMTEEKDVCQYLFQVSYPSLACTAVTNYDEPRFIEIVVGIFANLLCSKCEKTVKEEEIRIILDLLSKDDPYILIQVMRFLHAVSFIFEKLPFIVDEHMERINFILYNSTNKELLGLTLKTLSLITDDGKINENILKGELLTSAIVAYRVIKEYIKQESELEVFESQEQHGVVKHLIQFLCNNCCYIDNFNVVRLARELSLDEFTEEICILINFFGNENNLLPIDDDFKFYMEALTYIYRILAVPYSPTIFISLCKITLILVEKGENLDVVSELFCYFISVGSVDYLRKDLKKLPFPQIKKVLSIAANSAWNFEFSYLDNLRGVLNSL